MATAQQIQINRNRSAANKPPKTASQSVASFIANRKNITPTKNPSIGRQSGRFRNLIDTQKRDVAIKTSTGIVKLPQSQQTTQQTTQPVKTNLADARVNSIMKTQMPVAQRTGFYDKTLPTVWEGGVQKINPDYIPNAQKISIKNEREQMLRDKYYGDVATQNKYIAQSQQNLANRQAGIQDLADLGASKIEEADRKQRRYAREQISDVKDLANQSIEAQNIAREQSQANYDKALGIEEEDRQANRIRALRRIASSNIAGGSTAMSMQQEVDKTFNDTIGQLTEDQNFNERLIANAVSVINTNANKEIRAINESLLSPVQKQQAIQQIRLEAQNKGFELEDLAMQRQQEAERYTSQQYGQTLDKVLTMRDTQEVRAEDKRRYEQGLMTAQEQRNYERNQDALNQKLKGLEYMINSTPYGQSVQVPQELQQALGLPATIRGGDNTMIDNAIKSMQLSQGQLNLAESQLDYQGKQAQYAETYGLNQIIGGTDRASRHNNPTAMTTDVAKTLGLVEGVDYEKGDAFPDNPNTPIDESKLYFTAKFNGDPIETTIKALDESAKSDNRQAFYTQKGQQRWTYIGMSDQEWLKKSPAEKTQIIKNMYKREGGKGNFVVGSNDTGTALDASLTQISKGLMTNTDINKLVSQYKNNPDAIAKINQSLENGKLVTPGEADKFNTSSNMTKGELDQELQKREELGYGNRDFQKIINTKGSDLEKSGLGQLSGFIKLGDDLNQAQELYNQYIDLGGNLGDVNTKSLRYLQQKTGMTTEEYNKYKELEQKTGENMVQFVKSISGVAVSDKEYDRLTQIKPNIDMNNEQFQNALAEAKQAYMTSLRTKMQRWGFNSVEQFKDAIRNGGIPVNNQVQGNQNTQVNQALDDLRNKYNY